MESQFKKGRESISSSGIFCRQRWKISFLFFLMIAMANCDPLVMADQEWEGGGPFPVRNYSPIQLLFLSLPPEKAMTLSRGSFEVGVEASESSILLIESNPQINLLMKFEIFRSALHFKYGLAHQLEIGIEVPYLDRDGGFLDPFIMSIEEGFSNLNPNRVRFANGSFGGYSIRRNGILILSGEDNQSGLGDISLRGKWKILTESRLLPAAAIQGAVKFPTGNFNRAFGSGKMDLGVGLALQKSITNRLNFYFNQTLIFPGGDFGTTDLALNRIDTTVIALEYLWTSRFSLAVQFDYYTSPFHDTGSSILDNGTAEGVLGFYYRIRPRLLWQLYAIENFMNPQGSAADLSLTTDITYRF